MGMIFKVKYRERYRIEMQFRVRHIDIFVGSSHQSLIHLDRCIGGLVTDAGVSGVHAQESTEPANVCNDIKLRINLLTNT